MVTIREYRASDFAGLTKLLSDFQSYLADIDPHRNVKEFKGDESSTYLQQLLSDAKNQEGIFIVAEEEDELLGFIQGIIDRHQKDPLYRLSHKSGDHGWIGELYVTPYARSKGTGRQLVERIETYFNEKGCASVRLFVMSSNDLARKAYEEMGFENRNIELGKELS